MAWAGLLGLRDLAPGGGNHQLYERVGHVRLQPFGMPFLEADDVRNHATTCAIRIHVDLGGPWPRQQPPRWIRRVLPRAVVDVPGFRVHDLVRLVSRSARVLRRPLRRGRQALLIHLALAGLEDEGEVARWKLAQRCSRSRQAWRGAPPSCSRGGTTAASEVRTARVSAEASPRQAQPAVDPVPKEVCPDDSIGGETAL